MNTEKLETKIGISTGAGTFAIIVVMAGISKGKNGIVQFVFLDRQAG